MHFAESLSSSLSLSSGWFLVCLLSGVLPCDPHWCREEHCRQVEHHKVAYIPQRVLSRAPLCQPRNEFMARCSRSHGCWCNHAKNMVYLGRHEASRKKTHHAHTPTLVRRELASTPKKMNPDGSELKKLFGFAPVCCSGGRADVKKSHIQAVGVEVAGHQQVCLCLFCQRLEPGPRIREEKRVKVERDHIDTEV